ncbi:hypothetical protein MMC28_004828 [Mycoblastus sanguinarius]|nr:hypothetical protein [Mycoblastus sanguinarius]
MSAIAENAKVISSKAQHERSGKSKCFFPNLSQGQSIPRRWFKSTVDLEVLDSAPQSLQNWCRIQNVDLSSLFKAIWAIVLTRYAGTESVCFRFYAAKSKGDFVVSLRLEDMNTVESLFLAVGAGDASSSLGHVGDYSSVRGDEGAVGDASCNTCVCFFDEESSTKARTRAQFEEAIERCKGGNDILLSVDASQKPIGVTIVYSSSILSDEQVVHLGFAVSQGLKSIMACPDSTLRDIDLFSTFHRNQVNKWNGSVPEPVDACAYETIWQQILERPNAQAISSWDGDFTYAELGQVSDRLAQRLISLHVGPEVLVPVCFHKSKWAIVAMLAVMKAGGAFVPLNPFHPAKHLQAIIQDVSARFVLASHDVSGIFHEMVDEVVVVQSEEGPTMIDANNFPMVEPGNAAYVLYTSGSTGKPKGVIIEHRALSTNMKHLGTAWKYSPNTRVLQFASFTFDVAILDIFFTLAFGGCICVPSEDQRTNIVEAMNRMKVTFAVLTPSVARTISPDNLDTLETLVIGGEAVGHRDVAQWAERVHLINGYGPTESCIVCVYNNIASKDSRPDVIGCAVASTSWVVEPNNLDLLAPVGAVGELLVQGPTLARGYLNSQEKTEKAFMFPKWLTGSSSTLSQRVYKTGDLVRYEADGSLIYLGRKDTQVKLHGQRVELGEIEHYMLIHPLVENSIVLLTDIRPHVQGLVAVVAMHGGSNGKIVGACLRFVNIERGSISTQVSHVRDDLSAQLPAHMIPTVWLAVEQIPLLASGKLDRSTVAQWIANMGSEISSHNALFVDQEDPQHRESMMEHRIRGIISQVLDLDTDQIQRNQSFSSIGGDSIAAMFVQNGCRDMGIRIKYQDVFKSKSIAKLAQMASLEPAVPDSVLIDPDVPFRLSPVQQLYFTQPRLPNRFHSSVYLRFVNDVDASTAALAIKEIVLRHSMLRARFRQGAKGWEQSIVRDIPGSYSFQAHALADESQIRKVAATRHGELSIDKGPVFAADIFNIKSSATQMLFMVAHHLVVDLVSWQIIIHDLEVLLRSRHLPNKRPFPYWKWCQLQTEQCQNLRSDAVLPVDVPAANIDYWGVEDRPNNFKDALEGRFEMSSQETRMLLYHCNQVLQAEPVDAFVAAAAYSFSQVFNDRTPPTFFCENHGREELSEEVDLSGTVGWFNTLVPLGVGKLGNETFMKTLHGVRATREKIPGYGQPYFAFRCLHPEGREMFREHSAMEIFFNYTGTQQLGHRSTMLQLENLSGGEDVEDIAPDTRRLALLDVLVDVKGGCLQYTFLYNRHMKYQEKILRWIDDCQRSLQSLVSDTHNC